MNTSIFKEKDVIYKWDGKDHEYIEKTHPELAISILSVNDGFYIGQYLSRKETIYIPFDKQIFYWTADELLCQSKCRASGLDYKRNSLI